MGAGEGLRSEVLVDVHDEACALVSLESAVFDAAAVKDLSRCFALRVDFFEGSLRQCAQAVVDVRYLLCTGQLGLA